MANRHPARSARTRESGNPHNPGAVLQTWPVQSETAALRTEKKTVLIFAAHNVFGAGQNPAPNQSFGGNMLSTQTKRTTCIGDHLFIVEGAKHWALYDLKEETLISIDLDSGELLWALAQEASPSEEKLVFLTKHAEAIMELAEQSGIADRLFLPDTSSAEAIPLLEYLWLEGTDQCNHKCLHCYGDFCIRLKNFMKLEVAKRILSQARAMGCQWVQFVGGEPFMHRQLWEMIEYAVELGFPDIEIFTNLTLLKEEDINRIKAYNIHIATTLLGHNAEVHDACTQIPGSFNRWYRNIKKIQALGIDFRIGVVRMQQNGNDMEEIEAFLRREDLLVADEEFEPDDVRPTGRGCNNAVEPRAPLQYDFFFTVTPQFFHQARKSNPCWRGEMAVSAEGKVFPCVFSRQTTFGDANQDGITPAVQTLQQQCWVITLDNVDRCRDCEYRYACMDCRELSISSGHGLHGRQPRCQYDPYSDE